MRLPIFASVLFCTVTMLTGLAHAQPASTALQTHYPAGSIQSEQQASAALSEVSTERKEIEQIFIEDKNACYDKFFVSSCLNSAREKRRMALRIVRKVEVEANAFMRKEKADERDRAVAERQFKASEKAEQSKALAPETDAVSAPPADTVSDQEPQKP